MALRIMLPSKAKVGDTIHFAFPQKGLSGPPISGFEVTVNGKKIDSPEIVSTKALAGGSMNFVYKIHEAGIYQFQITPIVDGTKGAPRWNTLEVEA
jgi:hypothetical protein